MKRRLSPSFFDLLVISATFLAVLVCLIPIFHVLAVSLSSNTAIMSSRVTIFPIGFNTTAYQQIFSDASMVRSLYFTIKLTLIYTVVSIVLTILAAYPLTKKRLRGRSFFLILIVITMYFSGGIIPDYLLVRGLGLLDTIWALILPGAISAFNLIILKTFFSGLPEDLEEAATMEGASDVGILFRVVLPLSTPVLATLSLFYAVGKWNSFMDSLFYITDSKLYPLQLRLFQIVQSTQALDIQQLEGTSAIAVLPDGIKAAAVIFATIPIVLVYPWLQRYFVKGAMIGAIKG